MQKSYHTQNYGKIVSNITEFKDGVVNGVDVSYDYRGNIIYWYNMKNNEHHGLQKTYVNGNLWKVGCYQNGKLFGEQKTYSRNGSGKLVVHHIIQDDGSKILARDFMRDLGISYKKLLAPSDDDKVMIAMALGTAQLFDDVEDNSVSYETYNQPETKDEDE